MNRRIARLLAVYMSVVFLHFTGRIADRVAADDSKPASVKPHVFYTGHSFHMFVPGLMRQLVKAADHTDYLEIGRQGIGGSRVIQHWNVPDSTNKAKRALEEGNVGVFTMSPHLAIPDPGIDNFVELGLKHNLELRLLLQASWMPFDITSPDKRIKDNAERDSADLESLEKATNEWRKKLEDQATQLNQKHGRQAVFVIPAGNAVVELRRKVLAGNFPGISKQSELFRDPIGHGLGPVQALVTYCNYSAIFRRSAEGLKVETPEVTAEQHAILQKIAWETVSTYPFSGVAAK